jgi:hypothetical protein
MGRRHKGKYTPPVPYIRDMLVNAAQLAGRLELPMSRLHGILYKETARMTIPEMRRVVRVLRHNAIGMLERAERLETLIENLEEK